MNLKEKVVIVTGASSGIGRECAVAFAKKGAQVVVTYNKNRDNGSETFRLCQQYSQAILVHLDVTNKQSIALLYKEVMERFGRIDILVNNAGVLAWKEFRDHDINDITSQVLVNLQGLIMVTKQFIDEFYHQNNGIILNIASGAGKQAFKDMTVYCASKFGVRGFTQALAKELPAGVRTYCVNPPMTATPMTNFEGVDPASVAQIIVQVAEDAIKHHSGSDVDIWEYL